MLGGATSSPTTQIYELDQVEPGNEITGPAIVESVATTFAHAAGQAAPLDRHQIFHLSADGGLGDQEADGDRRRHQASSSPKRKPIGWEGKRLDQMLDDSERLFAETGSYCGLIATSSSRTPTRSDTRSCSPGCAAAWSRRARRR